MAKKKQPKKKLVPKNGSKTTPKTKKGVKNFDSNPNDPPPPPPGTKK